MNDAFERMTDLRPDEVVGRRLDDALPTRQAHQLANDLSRCAERGEPRTFAEIQATPTGMVQLQTTLSPVLVDGAVVGVVKTSQDVTGLYDRINSLSDEVQSLRRSTDDALALLEAVKARTVGPLSNILGFVTLLRNERDTPIDRQRDVLDLITETAAHALEEIREDEATTHKPEPATDAQRDVDLGRMCRNLAAVTDPESRLQFLLPDGRVHAVPDVLLGLLQDVLIEAATEAMTWLGIAVAPDPARADRLRLSIRYDIPEDGGRNTPSPTWLAARIEARGGTLDVQTRAATDHDSATRLLVLTLPGRLVYASMYLGRETVPERADTGPDFASIARHLAAHPGDASPVHRQNSRP